MKSGVDQKSFDVMKWHRQTRDRIYEETKDISFEERIRKVPFLSELYDRRKAP